MTAKIKPWRRSVTTTWTGRKLCKLRRYHLTPDIPQDIGLPIAVVQIICVAVIRKQILHYIHNLIIKDGVQSAFIIQIPQAKQRAFTRQIELIAIQ